MCHGEEEEQQKEETWEDKEAKDPEYLLTARWCSWTLTNGETLYVYESH